ncbi:MAG: glycosyltransferase family 4 protein [Umezawaea sp.]
MRIGFACAWDDPPQPTWSYTAWQLRSALRERAEVTDLGLEWHRSSRLALKVLAARRTDGKWSSSWKHHPFTQLLAGRKLRRAVRAGTPQVVVQIGDLARVDAPYLVYQDLSFDLLREHFSPNDEVLHFPHLNRNTIKRLTERQHEIYEGAAGVLAMSDWLAESLVKVTGLPPERVHVVPPGANALPAAPVRTALTPRPRRRLLFVGKDFRTKAGPQVVAALAVLRREVDPNIELTVVGPTTWPLPGQVPDGVTFLGRLPLDRVRDLYQAHDLFVMPSHFEGYGMALVEALAHGLPCVARNACAMPEIVRQGVNGVLVSGDDPADLAAVIASALDDDGLARRAIRQAGEVIARHQWSRAADDILRIASEVG